MQHKVKYGMSATIVVLVGLLLFYIWGKPPIEDSAPRSKQMVTKTRLDDPIAFPLEQSREAQDSVQVNLEIRPQLGPGETAQIEVEAMRVGDVARVAELIVFMPDARELVEAARLSIPAELQVQHATPELFAAFIFCGAQRIESFQILSGESETPDFSIQKIRFKFESEMNPRDEDIAHFRTSEGWRRVIDEGLAERIAAIAGSDAWRQK